MFFLPWTFFSYILPDFCNIGRHMLLSYIPKSSVYRTAVKFLLRWKFKIGLLGQGLAPKSIQRIKYELFMKSILKG
jgi:hypothetical protein